MSNLLTADILEVLTPCAGNSLIFTVGNSLREDDGVGPYIAGALTPSDSLKIINAGFCPENIIDEVISLAPQRIIIIDAADFGGKAGQARIIPEEAIPQTSVSTHSIPLNVVTGVIAKSINTKIFFIGIQTKTVGWGEKLSPEVRRTADALIKTVKHNYSC